MGSSLNIIGCRKMNEADKERFRREKEAYDRAVAGGGTVVTNTVKVAPVVPEPGTVQCIR